MAEKTSDKEKSIPLSRRDFIKTTALAAGAVGALAASGQAGTQSKDKPEGLPITMAGYNLDRTAALVDGRVKVEGCAMEFKEEGIGDLNTHVFSGPQELDVAEVGLHPYMLAFANGGFRDYALLPIFPFRSFRHRSVFIHTDRGIKGPEDLRGKTIGTPGYSSTSLTWIRGIFQDEYGVKPQDIDWVVAAADSSAKTAGKLSQQENILPDGISIRTGPAGKDESDLLESGDVDALFHAAEPRAYGKRHPKVARLFPDYRSVERAFFKKTGIFPIMHAVAIKKSLAKQNPWVVEAVFKAYDQAKQMAYQSFAKTAWFKFMSPWLPQEFEETRALMGDNFYSYGIEPNRKPLEALFRYSHEQGLAGRRLTIEEIFHPSSMKLED